MSAAQVEILRQPWKRVYTTNYDNVAEMSAARAGKRLTPVTLSDDRRDVPTTGMLSVHLNGYIDRLTQSNLWSEIKLTDTSYLTASIAQSPWCVLLRQDIEAARAVFFVGYSTSDLDIRRILFESDTLREKCFFVLGTPDASTIRRVSRFGVLASLDATAFAEALRKKSQTYTPPDSTPPFEHCFRKYIVEGPSDSFTDRYIFDLLLFGSMKPQLVWQSFHDNLRYLIARRAVELAVSRIESGSKAVVIHSDLGNGKTATVEGLKVRATERGFDVYSLSVRGESLFEELEWICKSGRRTILIVETYPDWFDVIDYIGLNSPKTISLMLTARTSTHDVTFDRLSDKLATEKIIEISVDRLTADECEGIVDLFDEYGLWGDLASKSRRAKLEYLNIKCHAQWHAILINRFQSPQIQKRFAPILESLSKKKPNYEIVIAILLLTVLDYLPSLDVLITMCGSDVLEQSFRRDLSVTELIDTASGRVVLRSSVAGQFILKQIADPNVVVGVLARMTKAADAQAGPSTFYFGLLKALTRF
ncbi:MAG: SIR2 family protein, partial [Acidobacteriota bacterium]|nr:SIR2 family protein [Acidobacteriota bacterium]